eukprot:snap_masked-scaffold385_size188773-processed-gene-0.7 protein:Tk10811 transcript:snap_masked-scaffold385_size188773-processed-gene-0.7-mRNA-1 annotation:"dolichol-phosphate mannosyltransferase subunit 3-like"
MGCGPWDRDYFSIAGRPRSPALGWPQILSLAQLATNFVSEIHINNNKGRNSCRNFPKTPKTPKTCGTARRAMTKLMDWLTGLSLLSSLWVALYLEMIWPEWSRAHPSTVLVLPLLGVAAFGVYSVGVIAYRVATFNDCEAAAEELQGQIAEARADLLARGLVLN